MFPKLASLSFLASTLFLSGPAIAAEPNLSVGSVAPDNLVFGAFGGHIEQRSGVSKAHIQAYAGYDRALGNGFYLGGRFGILQEQVLTFATTTSTKLFLGVQGYKIFTINNTLDLKAGLIADVAQGDNADPFYLYTGATVGPRFYLTHQWYLDVPLEVGIWPFFDGIPVFFKAAVQLGYAF